MGKTIDIGGRFHSIEQGNVVAGANEIYDDTKGKKQDVINGEVDAALEALNANKQDNLTFDQTPTESSTNPVTSGGVYAADAVLQQAIEAILTLIPSAASALNQLADKSFVNSSIATASATFRGTYNLVSDLHLSVTASHQDIATALASVVSTADNNDYCFVQIPTSDTSSDIRVTERYKFNGTAWAYEYDLNNSGFTATQWEAINSGITALLVTKLGALPTAAELATSLAGKQNVLTFDNVPVSGSDNPVKSGGLYQLFTAIDAKFPSDASANNKLVAENRLAAYVTAIIEALDASFDLTSADGHVTFKMTQTNGVIASVQILTSDIASASALTTLGVRVSTNETDIANLQAAYAGLTQSDIVVVNGVLPSSGQQQNVIYRQPDQGHTPPQFYSDYMWNGSAWVLMATYNNAIDDKPTYESDNIVKSNGIAQYQDVFDNQIKNFIVGGQHEYPLKKGCIYVFHNSGSVDYNVSYTNDGVNYISIKSGLQGGETFEYYAPENAQYIYFSNKPNVSLSVYKKGKVTNITDVVGESSPKNMENAWIGVNGGIHSPSSDWLLSDFLPVSQNDVIKWIYDDMSNPDIVIAVYNASKEFIDYYSRMGDGERDIIFSIQNGAFIRATIANNSKSRVIINGDVVFKKWFSHEERLNNLEENESDNVILDTIIINACSYNLGKFEGTGLVTPSDEGALTYRKAIGSIGANIIGTQEDYLYYSGMESGQSVRDVIFPMYKNYYRQFTTETNGKAFCSDYDIKNVARISYSDDTYSHPWFLVGEILVGNKKILLVSFHFDWDDKNRRAKQINQIIAYCSNYDNVIMMGDVNPNNMTDRVVVDPSEPYIFEEEFAKFKNAGFDLANGGNFDYIGTWYEPEGDFEDPQGIYFNQWVPIDNVFVKGGKIRNVWVVTEPYMNDHKPICATIVF